MARPSRPTISPHRPGPPSPACPVCTLPVCTGGDLTKPKVQCPCCGHVWLSDADRATADAADAWYDAECERVEAEANAQRRHDADMTRVREMFIAAGREVPDWAKEPT